MTKLNRHDDIATVAALGVIASCVVAFGHEALGHGGACLALGGRVLLLTSSLFRCDIASPLIDLAGPLTNFTIGALAFVAGAALPRRFAAFRLLLLLVGVFAWFWEGGYLVQAMALKSGDSYFAARDMAPASLRPAIRIAGAALGALVYLAAIRAAAAGLLRLRPQRGEARRLARTAWLAASLAAFAAAALYRGEGWGDLHDAVFEIAVASAPLLIVPRRSIAGEAAPPIGRSGTAIASAIIVFAAFAFLLGRGVVGAR